MKRSSVWFMVIMATIGITAVVAFASSVHLKNKPPLTFTDTIPASALELVASGALTGLGGGDVGIVLTANADPTSTCTNPSGANKPPGHNPASVEVTGTLGLPAGDIKNGNLTFTVATDPPTTPIPGAPDCPGSNWTEDITDLVFKDAIISVHQPSVVDPNTGDVTSLGPEVFTVTCDLSGSGGKLTASNCQ